MTLETERLIIDPVRETDREDYFLNISHDKKVLETFICNYAESIEDFSIAPYVGRDDLFAVRLKEIQVDNAAQYLREMQSQSFRVVRTAGSTSSGFSSFGGWRRDGRRE